MSNARNAIKITVEDAKKAQINTLKHVLWELSKPGKTIENARAYIITWIEELEAKQ